MLLISPVSVLSSSVVNCGVCFGEMEFIRTANLANEFGVDLCVLERDPKEVGEVAMAI